MKAKIIAAAVALGGLVFLLWTATKTPDAVLGGASQQDQVDHFQAIDSERNSSQKRTSRERQLEEDIAFIVDAYEVRDRELLTQRVQELMEKDLDRALRAFAKIDYTFLHYKLQFPHSVVAEHLATLMEGPEVMELLSEFVQQSSILNSVMGEYFIDWLDRDVTAQSDWLSENSSFVDTRVIAMYTEAIGSSENGVEAVRRLGQLPEDDVRKEHAHQKAMEFLSSEQPEEFASYLNELEEVPEYAMPSLYNLAEQLVASGDPAESMSAAKEWIDTVKDPKIREGFTEQIGGNFLSEHPDEFESWFASLNFSNESERQRVRAGMENHVAFLRRMEQERPEIDSRRHELTDAFSR